MRKIKLSTFKREVWDYRTLYSLIFDKVASNEGRLCYTVKTFTGLQIAYIDLDCKVSDLVPSSNPSSIRFYRSKIHEFVEVPFERIETDSHDDTWYQKVEVVRLLDMLVESSHRELTNYEEKVKNGKIS